MPRDILSDSLAVLRISEHEDENWSLDDAVSEQSSKKLVNIQNYPKDDCACYYNYGLGESNNQKQEPLYKYKTKSLPAAQSATQSWDTVVCSALRLSPEDIANQITLLDLPSFKAIRPSELVTCGWNKLNKLTIAPNVVAFTKRFNSVNFWTVQEILNAESPKARAEMMAHFIKVAKKLHDLNNLHALFAIISAFQSASIYRLTKSWAGLSKKDKQQFDRLAEIFVENDNWTALREYLRSISLPCIPFLGIFLTDLVYIDIAHPAGSPHRVTKMAVVLKAIERYQTSDYSIEPLLLVSNYLNSVRYIEELQKFLEDDQYKLSLKLEPPSPIGSCVGSKESVKDTGPLSNSLHVSPPHRPASGSLRLHGTFNQNKFIPTHRKTRSLGSNIFGKCHNEDKSSEPTPAGSVNLLDDTLLESPCAENGDQQHADVKRKSCTIHPAVCELEGFVRRKTVIKEGRKPSLSSWQRYWLQLVEDVLVFYSSKSFVGCSRSDFRSERCKVLPLEGWMAVWAGNDATDVFTLVNRNKDTVYKFRTGSDSSAKRWVLKIEELSCKTSTPLPANLMSFE